MILSIILMIATTVVIAACVFAPAIPERGAVFDPSPDRPSAFGYKMAWLAIKTRDTERVLAAVGVGDARPCNWRSGIGTVYDERLGETHVFVSPPVDGWTFVVGLPLPHPVSRSFVDKCTPLLLDLGGEFDEVQYFFTYPLIDFFAWARIANGRLQRAFAIGDEGIVWNKGRATREERALGLKLFELRGVRDRKGDAGGEIILYPTEDHVMQIASGWSVDPTRLDQMQAEPGTGYVGLSPAHWRAERLRRAG